jgi:hypothetical protein
MADRLFAVVEDAVLHARSLYEVSIGSADKDPISLRHLFLDLDPRERPQCRPDTT